MTCLKLWVEVLFEAFVYWCQRRILVLLPTEKQFEQMAMGFQIWVFLSFIISLSFTSLFSSSSVGRSPQKALSSHRLCFALRHAKALCETQELERTGSSFPSLMMCCWWAGSRGRCPPQSRGHCRAGRGRRAHSPCMKDTIVNSTWRRETWLSPPQTRFPIWRSHYGKQFWLPSHFWV